MKLEVDDTGLETLIERVVDVTLKKRDDQAAMVKGRLAFSESEAAGMIGVAQHTLRDCRMRGLLKSRKVGRRVFYERDELLRFLRDYDT